MILTYWLAWLYDCFMGRGACTIMLVFGFNLYGELSMTLTESNVKNVLFTLYE